MPDEAPLERGLVCFPPAICEATQIAESFLLRSPRNRLVEPKVEAAGIEPAEDVGCEPPEWW